jgi:hypothetical protein
VGAIFRLQLKVWAGRNDYAVFVDSARTKTLSGDDQPDLLLLNQDNGENWLGFTCVYRKPHPPMNSVPPLVAAWLGAISADRGTWPFARSRKGRRETDCQNFRLF